MEELRAQIFKEHLIEFSILDGGQFEETEKGFRFHYFTDWR